MDGILVQYLIGLYFAISMFPEVGTARSNLIKFILGVVFIVLAILHISVIGR